MTGNIAMQNLKYYLLVTCILSNTIATNIDQYNDNNVTRSLTKSLLSYSCADFKQAAVALSQKSLRKSISFGEPKDHGLTESKRMQIGTSDPKYIDVIG